MFCIKTTLSSMKIASTSLALAALTATSTAQEPAPDQPAKPPNVVMIMVDDAGYMDFGGYGGEAQTPHINRLADRGLRFTNYYTSTLCAPSRAMLITGIDNHRTGIGTIWEVLTDEQKGQPGYSQVLEPGVLTLGDRLRDVGYRTFMTGKWHLGDGEGPLNNDLPYHHGFDRSFTLDASGADNWEDKAYIIYYGEAPWFEDDQPADLPEDFYSSEFIVDKMIEYIEEDGASEAPFFSYLSFQAIHIPIQAPREFIDNYNGVYDKGWDALAIQRWENAKALGLINQDAPLPPKPEGHRAWDDLTEDERIYAARAMQVNAGMLEAMDYHIGRFVDYLDAEGELDNTIFVITSDNGPEFNDPVSVDGTEIWMDAAGYDADLENLGGRGSLAAIGPEWAAAAGTPGSHFKFFTTGGGIRVPMIMSGPGVERTGWDDGLTHVADIVPTLLEMIGVEHETRAGEVEITGLSLTGLLQDERDTSGIEGRSVGIEVSGNSAYIKGDYKIRRVTLPHGDAEWRLFNVAADPGETNDLTATEPEIFADLLAGYEAYEREMGVVALPKDFNVQDMILENTMSKVVARYMGYIVGFAILAVCILGLFIWLVWSLWRRVTA
ncbi:MAG: arylsulfatase [Pseudomonadota bacterium]